MGKELYKTHGTDQAIAEKKDMGALVTEALELLRSVRKSREADNDGPMSRDEMRAKLADLNRRAI